ncbi:hypothetical protein BDV30DRAFT_133943 [Aspergillus minisclerotigenes]|uniref:Uncharacterized protein n=1 Tax=Aspergillus minisclerotigenes TaxID=656917 RepID=A0A5N6J0B6_9EURO|nr:hypothetical protein BDV30DRAFT_133943 [Aspergillus minisclerotigenes]
MIPHLAIFGLVMTLLYSVSVPTVVSEKSLDRLFPEIFETKNFEKKVPRSDIRTSATFTTQLEHVFTTRHRPFHLDLIRYRCLWELAHRVRISLAKIVGLQVLK